MSNKQIDEILSGIRFAGTESLLPLRHIQTEEDKQTFGQKGYVIGVTRLRRESPLRKGWDESRKILSKRSF